MQGVDDGGFDGGGDLRFVLQLRQLVGELASDGAVIGRAEEPAVDHPAEAVVDEGEGEQERAGQEHDGEDVDGALRDRHLCRRCAAGTPIARRRRGCEAHNPASRMRTP